MQGSADSNYSQPSSDLSLDDEREALRRETERLALAQLEKARVSQSNRNSTTSSYFSSSSSTSSSSSSTSYWCSSPCFPSPSFPSLSFPSPSFPSPSFSRSSYSSLFPPLLLAPPLPPPPDGCISSLWRLPFLPAFLATHSPPIPIRACANPSCSPAEKNIPVKYGLSQCKFELLEGMWIIRLETLFCRISHRKLLVNHLRKAIKNGSNSRDSKFFYRVNNFPRI